MEHSPEHHATSGLSYAYDPDAKAPNWCKLLRDIDYGADYYVSSHYEELGLQDAPAEELESGPPVSELLQEFAGLAFTTNRRFEKILWLVGERGSGKSTFIEGLVAAVGADRSLKLDLDDVIGNKYAYASLPGKTLLFGTEQPARFLKHTNRLESLVSGEPVRVEQKYKEGYEYTPHAKLVWAMNALPKVPNPSAGLFRRVLVVPFPLSIVEKDLKLKDAIHDEAPGILNWALDGLDRLLERGDFEEPVAVRIANEEFQGASDVEARFVSEWCETGPDYRIRPGALYSGYKAYCKLYGYSPKNNANVAKDWKRLGYDKKAIKGERYYVGLDMTQAARLATMYALRGERAVDVEMIGENIREDRGLLYPLYPQSGVQEGAGSGCRVDTENSA